MIVLDTSALIEIERGTSRGHQLAHEFEGEDIVITIITLHEILVGDEHATLSLPLLEYNKQAVNHSSRIQRELDKKGSSINSLDVLIAGICLAHNATLVTCDKDFKKVPGLRVKVV